MIDRPRGTTEIDGCPHRRSPTRTGAGEVARCGLLAEMFEGAGPGLAIVGRDACGSCCLSFPPTVEGPNPVVASMVFARATRLAATFGPGPEADRYRRLAGSAREFLDVVHDDPGPPPPPAEAGPVPSLARLIPPPGRRHGGRVRRWAVGVTTSPRIRPTLDACLGSMARAGWDRPRLFLDAAVRVAGPFDGLPRTFRDEKIGAWPSYYLALAELLLRHPRADAYLVAQDDALFHDREPLLPYLETVLWPGKAPCLVSLYCAGPDSGDAPGWHAADGPMRGGPLAVAFPPELAKAFVSDRRVLEHRWDPDEVVATSIGDLVGEWAESRGVPVWMPTPSLVQHVGETSTLWPDARAEGPRRAARFAGDSPGP